MRFVGSNASFALILFTHSIKQASNTRLAGSMWPTKVFCAAAMLFGNFQMVNNCVI